MDHLEIMKNRLAESTYADWRSLRMRTVSHGVLCICNDCKKRGKLASRLALPYAGPPDVIRFKSEE